MNRAPKPWNLTEDETYDSFKSWTSRVLYFVKQDPKFAPYLIIDPEPATWGKHTADNPTRGFVSDPDLNKEGALSAEDRVVRLEDMLGLISQFAPPLLANDIVYHSTSIESVWKRIKKYYNIKQSETQFMKLATITWDKVNKERPEKLSTRVLAHLQANLMTTTSELLYDGAKVTKNEEMSPTLERWAVLYWMQLIHPGLPALVERTFAYDLQRLTLKDIQPQICNAIDGFLEELNETEIRKVRMSKPVDDDTESDEFEDDVRVARMKAPYSFKGKPSAKQSTRKRFTPSQSRTPRKECRICKNESRKFIGHTMAECSYVSKG